MSATALAVAFVVYSCKGKLGEAVAIKLDETPVQTVRDMFVVQTENGNIQMRASADLMEKYERDTLSYELFPEGFAVYGYTDEGLVETEIVADNARHVKYEDGRETWEAFGNVVVRNLIKQEYSPAEPRDPCLHFCLILASGAARHLPAHLHDTRQLSRATPACSSA